MLTQSLGEAFEKALSKKVEKEKQVIVDEDQQKLQDGKAFLVEHKVGYIVQCWEDRKYVLTIAPGLKIQDYISGYEIWIATEREWLQLDMERLGYKKIAKVDENLNCLQDFYERESYW